MTKVSIAAILVPGVAAAHPDHLSGGAFGLAHYLSDPFHVGLTSAVILLFIGVSRVVRRRQRPSR